MSGLEWGPQEWQKELRSVKTREGEQTEVKNELDTGEGKSKEQTQVLSPRCSRERETVGTLGPSRLS